MSNHPHPPSRTPPNDHYLQAKEQAINLIAELPLYLATHAARASANKLQAVMRKVEGCDSVQQGEVYLLCAQAMVQLDHSDHLQPFSSQFFASIQAYLLSLLQPASKQEGKPSLKETYSGKLKKGLQLPQHKRKLFDWLFVDRIDRALKTIASLPNFKGFGKVVKQALAKSVRSATSLLPGEELEEYQSNIEFVVSIGKKSEPLEKQRNFQVGKFIIIDESLSTHRQARIGMRKNSSSKLLIGSKTGRYVEAPSLADSVDSSRREDRKPSMGHQRSSKRGSLSSNCSKRSSTFRSEEKVGHRVSTRWGTKINAEIISSTFNKNRPFRRSNFQQIRVKDFDLPPEVGGFTKIHSIIEEEGTQEKQFEMKIHNLFVDGFLKSLRKMKPFYLYFWKGEKIILGVIEQLKEMDASPFLPTHNHDDEESFRIKLVLMSTNREVIHLSFPQLELGSHSKEFTCLAVLRQRFEFYEDELHTIKARSFERAEEADLGEHDLEESVQRVIRNVFLVQKQKEVIMGFIRKFTTHFLSVCTYTLQLPTQCNQLALRRRLLTEGRRLFMNVKLTKELISPDLAFCYKQQQTKMIREGSAIKYIQNEEEDDFKFKFQEDFRTKVTINAFKQHSEVLFRVAWCNAAIRHSLENARKRNNNQGGNLRLKQHPEQRRLKRVPLNKNSIKMGHLTDLESFADADAYRTYQTRSNFSKKDITHEKVQKPTGAPPKRKKPSREKHFIESVRTDKGYELILHKQTKKLEGCTYETYFGYKQRNPKRCRYYKDPPETKELDSIRRIHSEKDHYLRTRLTIHGQGGRAIESRLLISFTKLVHCEESFGGYLVSNIKLLPHWPNNEIFIESYWQARQKNFVFIVSAELFERLTDINTKHFEESPFLPSEQQQQTSKKRDKRTSVVASLLKDRETDVLKQSGNSSRLRRMRLHEDSVREIDEDSLRRKFESRTVTSHQMQTMGRVIKTADTCSTARNIKSSLRNQLPALRREVVLRLRSKIVKYASFSWRRGALFLQLKYGLPTQLESVSIVELEGHEVAIKNLHPSPAEPALLEATEFVLLKYADHSLANLNFCSLEGAAQIHLHHLFIKNSPDLYGRFSSILSLRELVDNHRLGISSREGNHFFEPRQQAQFLPHNSKIQSRNSYGDQQRKLNYRQIISLAGTCSFPFAHLSTKKNAVKDRAFSVPNRYPTFSREHLLLDVELSDEEIIVRGMDGEVVRVVSLGKLEEIMPAISRLPLKALAKLVIRRILKDADILQLCANQEP